MTETRPSAARPKTPWASGPGEILQHGLSLLRDDSDSHRRLAMLSIDNAVELMIKTFLGLPKRVTGLNIPRSRYDDFSESFPRLLDALQEFASDRMGGIDLGEIEWFHRLRNQLYHEGNGLTVERDKVRVYAQLARVLFAGLFDEEVVVKEPGDLDHLGPFIFAWSELERALMDAWARLGISTADGRNTLMTPRELVLRGKLDAGTLAKIERLRQVRNRWVHAHGSHSDMPKLTAAMIEEIRDISKLVAGISSAPG